MRKRREERRAQALVLGHLLLSTSCPLIAFMSPHATRKAGFGSVHGDHHVCPEDTLLVVAHQPLLLEVAVGQTDRRVRRLDGEQGGE